MAPVWPPSLSLFEGHTGVAKRVCLSVSLCVKSFILLYSRSHASIGAHERNPTVCKLMLGVLINAGGVLKALQERYRSSYVGSFARRLRDFDTPSEASLLKEIYRSNPERVVQIFESQPSLHNNSSALSQYVKALVALDRLDESPLLKTLQRGSGLYCFT